MTNPDPKTPSKKATHRAGEDPVNPAEISAVNGPIAVLILLLFAIAAAGVYFVYGEGSGADYAATEASRMEKVAE